MAHVALRDMNARNINLAKFLTYSGTLPLIASTIAAAIGFHWFDVMYAAITYGAVIVSFLCGIHWAIYLFFSESCPRNLLLTSNFTALIAWSSLLVGNIRIALIIQSLCFLFLLYLDHKLLNKAILPQWFYVLRSNATIVVVISLLAIAYL